MARDTYAQPSTVWLHERAIWLDGVAVRPAVEHQGWPNGSETIDAEGLSGNCCMDEDLRCPSSRWTMQGWRLVFCTPATGPPETTPTVAGGDTA